MRSCSSLARALVTTRGEQSRGQQAVSPTATTPPSLVTAPLRHELIATAGHFPHEEAPAVFNTLLVDWLTASR